MTESSIPWGGIVTGDAGPYSDDNWSDLWRYLFTFDRATEGPLVSVLNELAVTGAGSPIGVASGVALADGKFYLNTASVSVAIPTPAADTRIDRIVLRKSWAAQTVRVTRIEGVEGGAAPSITQVDGTTWDVPLAQVSITTGGAITITDEREFCWTPMSLLTQLTKRDTPTDGDIIVADSSADGDWSAVDRVRVGIPEVFSFRQDEVVTTGDDATRLPIPEDLDGYELCYVRAKVKQAPSGGPVTIQLYNIDNATDMLTTVLTIDDGETSSETAATPAVIASDGSENVDDGDDVRVDIDAANSAEGLIVEMGFKPR